MSLFGQKHEKNPSRQQAQGVSLIRMQSNATYTLSSSRKL